MLSLCRKRACKNMSPAVTQNNAYISLNIDHVAIYIKLVSVELSHHFAHFLFEDLMSWCRAPSVHFFPTFWGFVLLLGKIPTFSYFFRFLLKLIDKSAIFKPKIFFSLASLSMLSFNK